MILDSYDNGTVIVHASPDDADNDCNAYTVIEKVLETLEENHVKDQLEIFKAILFAGSEKDLIKICEDLENNNMNIIYADVITSEERGKVIEYNSLEKEALIYWSTFEYEDTKIPERINSDSSYVSFSDDFPIRIAEVPLAEIVHGKNKIFET